MKLLLLTIAAMSLVGCDANKSAEPRQASDGNGQSTTIIREQFARETGAVGSGDSTRAEQLPPEEEDELSQVERTISFDLTGSWLQACGTLPPTEAPDALAINSSMAKFIASTSTISLIREYYADNGCAEPVLRLVIDADLDLPPSQDPNARPLQLKLSRAEVTPLSEQTAKSMELTSYCNLEGWLSGESLEATNKNCSFGTGIVSFKQGDRTTGTYFSENGTLRLTVTTSRSAFKPTLPSTLEEE